LFVSMSGRRVLELCLCCDADALATLARDELGAAERPRQFGPPTTKTSNYVCKHLSKHGLAVGKQQWLDR
jgi:hypothetical protein